MMSGDLRGVGYEDQEIVIGKTTGVEGKIEFLGLRAIVV
jgi:hypothetical protein